MLGQRIGRYEIVEELGRGGMGVVYQARDTILSRIVALKALPHERAGDPDRRRRFLNEARSASALRHPNIVTIHDHFEHGGTDWIVMEYVEGRTLAETIPPGGLPLGQALGWAADATDAVGAAHEAGVIHRDLKPGNLMIDGAGRLRVLDFGLAKLDLLAESGIDDATPTSPMTVAGTVMGTLEYMSPEQAMGRPVDPRSDVFSLGAVLYQMLTGRRPFSGVNAASKVFAVSFAHPDAPHELRPEIPEEVSGLVLRALEKQSDDRFQTMAEMGEALRGILRRRPGGAVEAEPVGIGSWWKALESGARRRLAGRRARPWLAAAAAAVILTAVFVGAASLLAPSWKPALPGTPYAELQEASALLDAFWRDGYVDQAVDRLQRVVDEDPGYAPAYAALAEAYTHRYGLARDPAWLDRARAQAERALLLDPTLSRARVSYARVLLIQGESEAAEAEAREVLARDPANAAARVLLGDVAQAAGETEAAVELFREASSLAAHDPIIPAKLGAALYAAARYEEAAEAFRRVTAMATDYAIGHSSLAAALHMSGRYGEAAEQLQKALQIRPDAPTYSNLGTLYFFQGLYPQALEAFERAIELGANDYRIWANLGDAYRWSPGRERDARRAYTRALQLLAEELEQAPDDPTRRSRRALLQAKRATDADRTESAATAEDLATSATEPGALYRLALVFELTGRRDRALEVLARALEGGLSVAEVRRDPELTELRIDPRYHLIMVDHDGEG